MAETLVISSSANLVKKQRKAHAPLQHAWLGAYLHIFSGLMPALVHCLSATEGALSSQSRQSHGQGRYNLAHNIASTSQPGRPGLGRRLRRRGCSGYSAASSRLGGTLYLATCATLLQIQTLLCSTAYNGQDKGMPRTL